MTREAAHAAARALLDAMAGTTEGEWEWRNSQAMYVTPGRDGYQYGAVVLQGTYDYDAGPDIEATDQDRAYIARACPARLGPVLRALMGERE